MIDFVLIDQMKGYDAICMKINEMDELYFHTFENG